MSKIKDVSSFLKEIKDFIKDWTLRRWLIGFAIFCLVTLGICVCFSIKILFLPVFFISVLGGFSYLSICEINKRPKTDKNEENIKIDIYNWMQKECRNHYDMLRQCYNYSSNNFHTYDIKKIFKKKGIDFKIAKRILIEELDKIGIRYSPDKKNISTKINIYWHKPRSRK